MPIDWLPGIDRRRFLAGLTGALACAPALGPDAEAGPVAKSQAPEAIALLSDTHIAADPERTTLGQNMAANLRQAVADLLAQRGSLAAAFLNGDLALKQGLAEDYRGLMALLRPLHEAGLPIYLGLGNHDDRDAFRGVVPERPGAAASFVPRHVSDVRLTLSSQGREHAWRILLLDSLNKVDDVPGLLGPEQLLWLQDHLDEPGAAEIPTLVLVHHHPTDQPNGLIDTETLLRTLGPRRQVKALVFGHTHVWSVKQRDDGLWLVNLPAVAYPFAGDQPLGWVKATPTPAGARLELRAIGGDWAKDRQVLTLAWR